jgi:hypothetical protein
VTDLSPPGVFFSIFPKSKPYKTEVSPLYHQPIFLVFLRPSLSLSLSLEKKKKKSKLDKTKKPKKQTKKFRTPKKENDAQCHKIQTS